MSFRVFLTGGTGYVGSAVLDALVRGGHQVTAIARDPEKVAGIESRGARGLLAELGTPARYMDIALESDVVVHAALEHSPRGPQLDGDLLDRLLPALSDTGSAKTFIYTSGIWLIGPAPDPADESVPIAPTPHAAWRAPLERRVLEATTLSLRHPPSAHAGSDLICGTQAPSPNVESSHRWTGPPTSKVERKTKPRM